MLQVKDIAKYEIAVIKFTVLYFYIHPFCWHTNIHI